MPLLEFPRAESEGSQFAWFYGTSGKEPTSNAGDMRPMGSIPGWEDPLEEGMTAHSRILAWRIPWTEEPGGLQSTGLQSWTRLKQLSMHAVTFS